ncbi:MAG: 3-methyl-2-oxobutanoate hydroxymethyltransferase [Gammaproteobacteria bacterium]|nr:3-methyl-2-oxobutanoate hydroxymethyltransferase [Gammaproteobacteria bacterium]
MSTVLDFIAKKNSQQKITMLTCYDYMSASLLAKTEIDCLLVGDSLAMVVYGLPNTIGATVEMMVQHTQAVARGAPNKFIVTDLPFLSYRKLLSESVTVAQKIMQAGACAVKLEGAAGNLELISHLTQSGIPVMGHLGLTPQLFHALGGYVIQGKTKTAQQKLVTESQALAAAGAFAIILECIPSTLAKMISKKLTIPTIGIGAGKYTDGQVLVLHDLLGMNPDFKPKFVKTFLSSSKLIEQSVAEFIFAVQRGEFPSHEHSY